MTQLPTQLTVECRPVPPSPFYVRWLNRFGGIDYWMFEKRQTFERKQTSHEDFQPYLINYEKASGTNYSFAKEVCETVKAGAELLTPDEWHELSRIAYSPAVQWYNEDIGEWIDITVDKSDAAMITDNSVHAIEIIFLLPQPQLQF